MDRLTLFGLFAVTAMLVIYALETAQPLVYSLCARRPLLAWLNLWLSAGGLWPFGLVEAIWGLITRPAPLRDDPQQIPTQ